MFNQYYQESSNGGKPFESIDVNERYRIILEINNAIISNLKLYDLFQATAKAINERLSFDSAGLSLYEPERDVLKAYAVKTFSALDRLSPDILQMPRVGSRLGFVFDNKKPLIASDLYREQQFATDKIILEVGLRSYIVTPLMVGERAIGTFNVGSKTPNKFREADAEFLSLVAKQIAIAIDNARSHEEIEKLKNRLEIENISLKEELKEEYNFDEIIGRSKALKKILAQVEMVAKGQGKETFKGWRKTERGVYEHIEDGWWNLINSDQDRAAQESQGLIFDRTREYLGTSDAWIVQFRKMLLDQMKAVEEGRDPLGVIRDPAKNDYIYFDAMMNFADGRNTAPEMINARIPAE